MAAINRLTPLADLPEMLRVPEVAAWCDASEGVVREAIRSGQLGAVRLGRLLRVPRSAVEKWIAAGARCAS